MDITPKYNSFEYHIDEIKKGVSERLNRLLEEKQKLDQQIKPISLMPIKMMEDFKYPTREYRTYAGYVDPDDTVEKCNKILSDLENHYKNQLELIPANDIAIKNNIHVYENAVRYMESLGLPKSTISGKYVRGKYKSETHATEWYTSLQKLLSGDNRESVRRSYENTKRSLEEKIVKIRSVELAKEKEVKQKELEEKRLFELAELKVRYGLSATCEPNDILDKILSSNKYLRLAHYLSKNREDWTDGHEYASIGIDGFAIEDKLDKEIFNCISYQIDNWDGDGRCFRDCEYNYDVLFGMVNNPQLSNDYAKITEILNRDRY